MSYTQVENILGQPIPTEVVNQLKIRSKKTQGKRDDQALVYTANKSAWVRVVSSIDISGSLAGIRNEDQAYLAKNNVLFGGTSAYKKTDTKQGFTYELKPYYSQDAIDPVYGFRPMPGITSAKILTQGRLGSILVAEIDFKANTKAQLDLVDILYFKIGYTMLVEWGNTFYYKQKASDANNDLQTDTTLYKSEDEALDPFSQGLSKEAIRIKIANAVKKTHGNYGGMLGVVTNYSFTTNVDGGYDCKIKIMSPGMLAESMRVNGIQSLPQVYRDAIDQLANVLTKVNQTNAELERARQKKEEARELSQDPNAYPPCVRNLINSGELPIATSDNGITGAGARVTSGVWSKYTFYYDTSNPTNPTKGRYAGPNSTADYTCDQTGENIIDKSTGAILGKVIKDVPKKLLYEDLLKDSSNQPDRYAKLQIQNKYPSSPNSQDFTIYDKGTNPNSAYYVFTKFKKVIDIKTSGWDNNPTSTKEFTVKLDLSPRNLGFITDPQTSWQKILEPNTIKESDGTVLTISEISKKYPELAIKRILGEDGYKKTVKEISGQEFKTGLIVDSYDNSDSVNDLFPFGNFGGDTTLYEIEYAAGQRGFKSTKKLYVRYSNYFLKLAGLDYPQGLVLPELSTISNQAVKANLRLEIIKKASVYLSSPNINWKVKQLNSVKFGLIGDIVIQIDNVPATVTFTPGKNEASRPDEIKNFSFGVRVGIAINDLDLVTSIDYANPLFDKETQTPEQQAQQNETQQATEQPLEFKTIDAKELAKSEASMYTSQLEAMLRVIQITTIANTINEVGILDDVKKITWTEGKYEKVLFDGLFVEGAMMSGTTSILRQVATTGATLFTDQDKDNYIKGNITNQLQKYKINLYYGFARNLMKGTDKDIFKELEKPEYKVNFKELLTSYVIPYYQSKTLVDGGDIHYPTYIPLGFFFMMLNHCSFLYDTSDPSINVPMFYLDFNPGTNIMLSSDFMLTSNPYKFVVPFTGDVSSYKKLFEPELIKGDTIGSGSDSSKIWKLDAVSSYIPSFKYTLTDANKKTNVYRGKTMNVLVSIDYLLDVIKRHSQRDETNSVYFRPLIEELLGDLGKCLGSFNVFRLAYDDNANCFYVVDDEVIPGDQVTKAEEIAKISNMELPLFGKDSVAKTFTITTENSSKLGSMAFISANQDVKNQASLGIDGTSIGNLSLYAVDRYKRVTTAANGNKAQGSVVTVDLQKKAVAASRFNEAVNSFYYGGLRSENMVDQATNYYIEAVARTRAGATGSDEGIRATTMLPLTVNFSTDGISSMAIYQAFTVNQELLPYSYKYGLGQSSTRQIGFIITGLEHTIQNNTWTTDVKANMYYVKRIGDYGSEVKNMEKASAFDDIPVALLTGGTATGAVSQNATITDTPWSAAFISYVMKQASVDFPVNASHTGYAQSLRNNNRGFMILNPLEYVVKIGDIIVQNRSGNSLKYSTDPWSGYSHGDIVVGLEGDSSTRNYNLAYAIGGNVNQTVFKSQFTLSSSVLIKPGFFVILRPPEQYINSIVSIVNREYDLWKRNNWKELSADAYSTIKQYYSTVSINI